MRLIRSNSDGPDSEAVDKGGWIVFDIPGVPSVTGRPGPLISGGFHLPLSVETTDAFLRMRLS